MNEGWTPVEMFTKEELELLYNIADWVDTGGVVTDQYDRDIAKRVCMEIVYAKNGIENRFLSRMRGFFADFRNAKPEQREASNALQRHITDLLNERN